MQALDEFPQLLNQARPEPVYSAAEVAIIKARLSRFDAIVRAAYKEFETYFADPKRLKQWRRKLLKARWQLRNGIRFSLRFGTPCGVELERLDRLEAELVATFPDVEPRAPTSH